MLWNKGFEVICREKWRGTGDHPCALSALGLPSPPDGFQEALLREETDGMIGIGRILDDRTGQLRPGDRKDTRANLFRNLRLKGGLRLPNLGPTRLNRLLGDLTSFLWR